MSATDASDSAPAVRPARIAPPEAAQDYALAADLRMVRFLSRFARPSWRIFVSAILLIPFASGATLVYPLLKRQAIAAILVEQSGAALSLVVGQYVVVLAFEFVARFAQTYLLQYGGQMTVARIRTATFAKIQRLHIAYFDRTPVGRIVTRVTNDVDGIGELFASGAVMAVADIVMLVGIVVVMLVLDWSLSLVAFAALPPLAIIVNLFRRFARVAFRRIRTKVAQLNAYMAEQVQGLSIVQAFGREAECLEEYRGINAEHRDANHRSIRYDALLYSVVESVSSITVALMLFYAAAAMGAIDDPVKSALYLGTVIAFYDYMQRFFVPIRDLSQKLTILQSSLAAAERIYEVHQLDELDAPQGVDAPPAPLLEEDVVLALRGVSFGYRPGQTVLSDIDLTARRGETIALVGATGAGKTTVTSLLLRYYDVQKGSVMVGGLDVRAQPVDEVRRRFAVVGQGVFLFAGTVLDNVAAADAEPDEARARDALTRVGAWPLLARRGGLRAEVVERGANFSAGERQLLAFARALYLDREILMLDEATARIDSASEERIQRALATVLEGRTALVIAHRLSTVRDADRILVFHKGRIVEEGNHASLVAQGGVYARLVRLQFADTERSPGPVPVALRGE